MKILIVNTSDIQGGAAKAAYRLFKALERTSNIEVYMLVQKKESDDHKVLAPSSKVDRLLSIFRLVIDQLPVKFYRNREKILFSPNWVGNKKVIKMIMKINPDIVHLHWINGGMIKIEDLKKIKKPIVWTLHDMWAFTGGCHYSGECEEYKNMCGKCKVLNSKSNKDLSSWVFKRKNKVYKDIDKLTIIGLSKWLNDCSKNSTLLKNKQHINLPNPINTNIFKPLAKEEARELWDLPKGKRLILFGAMNSIHDSRKGFKQLIEMLKRLSLKDIELVVFGSGMPEDAPEFGFETHYVGMLHDDVSLVTLYSAADVMVVPSLQENLSNTIMESLSCATPVVAFNIGGNSDMIDHKINGYLAKPFDPRDLANGVEWVLSLNKCDYENLCKNAREKILREFDSKVVAARYVELYRRVLGY